MLSSVEYTYLFEICTACEYQILTYELCSQCRVASRGKMLSPWLAGLLIVSAVGQHPGEMKKNAVLKMDMEECSGQMNCKTREKSL